MEGAFEGLNEFFDIFEIRVGMLFCVFVDELGVCLKSGLIKMITPILHNLSVELISGP